MGGICGIVDFAGPVSRVDLDRLIAAVPDRSLGGTSIVTAAGVALARLKPPGRLEPSDHREPATGTARPLVVADVRLDNRADLLDQLTAVTGPCPTDADLISAAYERWGLATPDHLVGDYAFALWDPRSQRLLAARDGLGMRPLYYRVEPWRTLFGSEARQLLADPAVPVRVCEPMIAAHLAGAAPAGGPTFYEGISSLAPGSALLVESGGHRTWRYWDGDATLPAALPSDTEEHAGRFREVFVEAVRSRLHERRDTGILLSGGLDSGSVASAAGWLRERDDKTARPAVRAYCWAFTRLPGCDERSVSRLVSDHYRLPVTEIPAERAFPLQDYPVRGPDVDDPFLGPYSALWAAALARAEADGVVRVLSGGRGDLLVGDGVFDELGLLRARRFADLQADLVERRRCTGRSWPRTTLETIVIPAAAERWSEQRAPRLRRRLSGAAPPPPWIPMHFARRVGLADMLAAPAGGPGGDHARRRRARRIHDAGHARAVTWLERLHSRFGLEYADPWSDRRLAEVVLSLPQWAIQRRGDPKGIARRAMAGLVPEPFRRRSGTVSPRPFFELALRQQSRATVDDLLTRSRAQRRGFVDADVLRGHYFAFLGGAPLAEEFWWALTLEMWLRAHHDPRS